MPETQSAVALLCPALERHSWISSPSAPQVLVLSPELLAADRLLCPRKAEAPVGFSVPAFWRPVVLGFTPAPLKLWPRV
jgi:hypothetical protein